MNILHINSYYVSRELYKNIYDYQVDNGNNIEVFVPVRIGRNPEDFDRGTYTKISYDFTELDRYIFWLKHGKIYRDIKRQYDIDKFDITHAHSLFSNGYIAYRLKKEYGIPYIVAVRNSDVNDFYKKQPHLRGVGNRILNAADGIVFLSKPYKDYVISNYVSKEWRDEISAKSVVIHNGIDSYWIRNRNTTSHKLDKKIKILTIGTIDRNKNYLTTIKVIKRLNEAGTKVEWTVVGKIVDKQIYDQIIESGLANYYEPMSKENLISIYRKNDIFLLPSIKETFGLVYAEAISQGLAIIYTRGQGFDQIFTEGEVGYSVNCMNVDEITNNIEKIIDNYDVISSNLSESIDRFNWDTINRQYICLYNKCLEI